MSQEEVSFDDMKQEMALYLLEQRTGVLATADGEYVTARGMLIWSDGLIIYCFTGTRSRKCSQITANPNVAVTAGYLQIEGVARLTGDPLEKENTRFLEVFKEIDPEVYEKRMDVFRAQTIKTSVIEITPTRVARYYPRGFMDILNIQSEKAYKTRIGEPTYYN